ncbi:TRAP transporter substrate-binding protein [Ammoniphilus resinae]|nr:TRAP transporter substrate-binding protein [Ammoniphilus resinae]
MKKVHWMIGTTLLASSILAGCGGSSTGSQPANNSSNSNSTSTPPKQEEAKKEQAGTEKIVIKLGHTVADTTSLQKGSLKFKEIVEQKSNGQMEVQVFPSSQLGNEKDMIEGNKLGTFQISIPSAAMMSNFAPKAAVLALPYVIKGENEREKFASLKKLAQSDAYKEIATEAEAAGLKIIPEAVWWYGDRQITTKGKEIATPDALAGLKIRTPDAKAHTEPFKIMGANVTPMAFTEVYMALSTGTIEAQENPINTIYTSKFFEVQDTINLTGHMTQNQIPSISLKWWNTLSSEQQQIIKDAMIEAGDYQSEEQLKANEEELGILEKNGMKVVKPDLNAFREATKDTYKSFLDKFDQDFYEKIKKAQE